GQVGQGLLQRGQTAEYSRGLQPVTIVDRRVPGNERSCIDRVRNPGLRGCDDTFADRQVPGDADLAGERDAVLERRAAGDADLRRDQRVAPDLHAVRHLHEVVDLAAGADARLADPR